MVRMALSMDLGMIGRQRATICSTVTMIVILCPFSCPSVVVGGVETLMVVLGVWKKNEMVGFAWIQ
jgi:hypothetical protein